VVAPPVRATTGDALPNRRLRTEGAAPVNHTRVSHRAGPRIHRAAGTDPRGRSGHDALRHPPVFGRVRAPPLEPRCRPRRLRHRCARPQDRLSAARRECRQRRDIRDVIPEAVQRRFAACKMFSPNIWWMGSGVDRSGSGVGMLRMYPLGVRPFGVVPRRARLSAAGTSGRCGRSRSGLSERRRSTVASAIARFVRSTWPFVHGFRRPVLGAVGFGDHVAANGWRSGVGTAPRPDCRYR